jgi:ribonucleoside-diphosphate reductase alpha chain
VKGITIFRDGCRAGVLQSRDTKKEKEEKEEEEKQISLGEVVPSDHSGFKKRGNRTQGATTRVVLDNHNMYVTVNKNRKGELVEVFATVGESKKPNTRHTSGVEDSWAEGLGKVVSLALRAGVHPDSIIRNLKNIPSDKPVFATIGDSETSEIVPSPPHAIGRVMEEERGYTYQTQIQIKDQDQKDGFCQACGSENIRWRSSTCYDCIDCGNSGCG